MLGSAVDGRRDPFQTGVAERSRIRLEASMRVDYTDDFSTDLTARTKIDTGLASVASRFDHVQVSGRGVTVFLLGPRTLAPNHWKRLEPVAGERGMLFPYKWSSLLAAWSDREIVKRVRELV
jgi:hypothetical protein